MFARGFENEGACHAEGVNALLMEVCVASDIWRACCTVSSGCHGVRDQSFSE